MADSIGLETILNRLEAGKRLSKQDLKILVTAVRSQQVTLATGDRAVAIGGSADGAVIVTGDRNIVITGTDAAVIRELISNRPRNEKLLLKAIQEEVTLRLKQSLHHQVLIQLRMETHPEQVKRYWDSEIKIGDKAAELVPDDWSILQTFDEVQGKLLVLGKPGSGKTTTMLELARELCSRAEQEVDFPVPVLLNLSAWKDDLYSLKNWLILELRAKYGVRKDVGTQLLESAKLLFMLDGLDELSSTRQTSCIRSINHMLNSEYRPRYLTICSRQEEYDDTNSKLSLNGAVLIQKLSDGQIWNYLQDTKQERIWQLLKCNYTLLELVRSPLILNILILSYEESFLPSWNNLLTEKLLLEELLDAYVRRMLNRNAQNRTGRISRAYSTKQVRCWLVYLAKQLERESQTEFFLEQITPNWFSSKIHKWSYRVGIVLNICVVSTTLSCFLGVLSFGWEFGIAIGLTTGLLLSWSLITSSVTSTVWRRAQNQISFFNLLPERLNLLGRISSSLIIPSDFHVDDPIVPERASYLIPRNLIKSFLQNSIKGFLACFLLVYFLKFPLALGLLFALVITLIPAVKEAMESSKERDLRIRRSFGEPIKRSLIRATLSCSLLFIYFWWVSGWQTNFLFLISFFIKPTTNGLLVF